MKISYDTSDIIFRVLFCLIFVALGGEHMLSDDLIQRLMPDWVPWKRSVSFVCGLWLSTGGAMIAAGWHLRFAAYGLGAFLIVVTLTVHVPGLFSYPAELDSGHYWMWDILQRTNLVKNVCLIGVCFHLLHHKVGRYSVQRFLEARKCSA